MQPVRIVPPGEPLGRIAFFRTFARNPLEVIPRSVYEEDFVPVGGARPRAVWITSPALVKAVLLDERDKFRKLTQIRLFRPLLGKGILTSEGAEWKWQRQASSPMFRPDQLSGFTPRFAKAAHDAVDRWADGSVQPVDEEMTRVTFDVISTTLLPSKDERFAAGIQRSVSALQRHGGWDILYAALSLPQWVPRPGGWSKLAAMRRLRGLVTHLVRERRDAADDLMQRLVAARDPDTGQSMDESRLVDNLLTFYLAGHETTAKALTWSLYLLARFPQWQDRLAGNEPSIERFLQESMRLYPPVPIMSRQCVDDAVIDGREVRAGTSVLIPIYAVHRHAKRWERPDDFDPSRFEAEVPRYQFMPFGAGPRVCIGRSFAMLEAVTILSTLLRRVRFESVGTEEPYPVAGVTLVPRNGLRLRIRT